VFGGVSIYGGKGNIIGAVIGVVTFSVISNGLNMMGVSQYAKQVVIGAVLLSVLAFNIWRERRSIMLGK
jgi:ribose/xylose/arabinose/galactoside ABC-type transport system permease subunit